MFLVQCNRLPNTYQRRPLLLSAAESIALLASQCLLPDPNVVP